MASKLFGRELKSIIMSLSKALKLISPTQLTNFVRFLGDDSHIMIIDILNEGLDKNESLK